jgi:hypothetical protein
MTQVSALLSSTPERRPNPAPQEHGGKRIVSEQKAFLLSSSTPERQPDIPDVVGMPGPQEYQTPSASSGRKRQRASSMDGVVAELAKLTPFTYALSNVGKRSPTESAPSSTFGKNRYLN